MAHKTIEQVVAAAGGGDNVVAAGGGDEAHALEHLRQVCRCAFAAQQEHQRKHRNSKYVSEIREACADLAFELEEGISEEASGYAITSGNVQHKVAVDVLLDEDVVEGEDCGGALLGGGRSLRRRLLEFNKWNVVQVLRAYLSVATCNFRV
jgi:hypothetical protein